MTPEQLRAAHAAWVRSLGLAPGQFKGWVFVGDPNDHPEAHAKWLAECRKREDGLTQRGIHWWDVADRPFQEFLKSYMPQSF